MSEHERRRSPRFDARYRVRFDGGEGVTLNLSGNGIAFATAEPIVCDAHMRLQIERPEKEAASLLLQVRILRVEDRGSEFVVAARIERVAFVDPSRTPSEDVTSPLRPSAQH